MAFWELFFASGAMAITAILCIAGIVFCGFQLLEAFAIWRSMRRRNP